MCEAIVDCEHKTAPVSGAGYPSIRTTNIKNGRIDLATCARVDRQTYEAWTRRRRPAPGDLVLAREAPVGEVGIVPVGERVVLGQRTVLICPDRKRTDPHYLLFVLLAPEMRRRMTSKAGGSTVDHLNMRDIRSLPLPAFPSLRTQRAIAAVLSALDDKIEVNRKRARVLEGIARAMFTSWFVDFDPVRRKAAGEPTGLPAAIASLFPERLVDSPIGEVPEGWNVIPLPEAFEINPTRTLRRGELAPYLDMSSMPTQGHAPAQWVQREVGSGTRFINGDTLVARITPCLENGKTAFVDFLGDGEVAWGSTEYIVLRPRPPLPAHFAYLLARSEGFRTFAIQAMTGSSGRQRVPASSLAHFAIAVPPRPADGIATQFGELVEPLFARMSTAMSQSRTLAALRDTLLPKLISGELRIADAEQIVGRAV
ncbi:MAG TPA: restriction endonuclease subunit S [Phycisphaerales bacterium]|nr:restriction endonuclease subunit S [Phycisphaerales bacterium]HMP36526.1 restriction endonuclease subunit S [Phycisphaerales bacterium]